MAMARSDDVLYSQIACAYNHGADIAQLCEAFQRTPQTINRALKTHGVVLSGRYISKRGEKCMERRALAIAAYASGASVVEITKELGITRERVYQYLRPDNYISLKRERDKMARAVLESEQQSLVAAAKAEHKAKLAAGMELVRAGLSYPKACRQAGLLYPGAVQALAKVCQDAGIVNLNGRHRDFSARIARVRELRATGMRWNRILEQVAAEEGRKIIYYGWLQSHVPDLLDKKPNG
jgi:transposase